MASLPVNNNLNVLANIANQVNQAANVPDNQARPADEDSFGMVMGRVNMQTNAQANHQAGQKTTAGAQTAGKTMSVGVASAGFSKQSVAKGVEAGQQKPAESEQDAVKQIDGNAAEKNVLSGDDSKDVKEAVTEAGEELVKEIAEEMDVSPEEVEEAMEVLGFGAIQLLDPENMKQLLITLSGNEDHLSMITDGELYGHFQNLLGEVTETLEDLAVQLGLSEEDLNALIADLVTAETKPELGQELIPQPEKEEAVNLEGMKDYAVTVHNDGDTIEVKVTVDDASGEQSVKAEVTQTSETRQKAENGSNHRDAENESKGESSFTMQTPVEQPDVNEILPQPSVERFISTEDIMNQITEYIKINLKGDVQELEMQLHPASLGTVNVQIAAKNGVITAQFTAQNEAVKAAIESQLVQLKTQFEEQGIKVDAVEVAVGDYRFGQSFSQNGENQESGNNGSKKSRRKLNLNELDLEDLPEDMEDSERIAAEMMASSGNTVDYTA